MISFLIWVLIVSPTSFVVGVSVDEMEKAVLNITQHQYGTNIQIKTKSPFMSLPIEMLHHVTSNLRNDEIHSFINTFNFTNTKFNAISKLLKSQFLSISFRYLLNHTNITINDLINIPFANPIKFEMTIDRTAKQSSQLIAINPSTNLAYILFILKPLSWMLPEDSFCVVYFADNETNHFTDIYLKDHRGMRLKPSSKVSLQIVEEILKFGYTTSIPSSPYEWILEENQTMLQRCGYSCLRCIVGVLYTVGMVGFGLMMVAVLVFIGYNNTLLRDE